MKKLKLTILSFLIALVAQATVWPVTPTTSGNDIGPNIVTAVGFASQYDTVSLPAGNYRVDGTINITKKIRLIGHGIDTTTLYRDESISDATLSSWGPMIQFTINSDRDSKIIVSRMTLKSQIPLIVAGDGGSLAADIGLKIINAVDFVVHDCKIMYFGDSGIQIRHRDYLARGLIDKCIFYRNSKGTDGLGLGYGVVVYGEGLRWWNNIQLGGPNFIFIEDCTDDFSRHSIAEAGGARIVYRHNKIRNHLIATSHALDIHQSRGPGHGVNTYGTRAYEFYGNSIINTTMLNGTTLLYNGMLDDSIQERAIGLGNGDGVVYNDTINGYRFAVGLYQSEDTTGVYPFHGQLGEESGLNRGPLHTGTDDASAAGDAFIWNITFTSWTLSGGGHCALLYNYDALTSSHGTGRFIVADRDYHYSVSTPKPKYTAYPYPHPKRLKIH